MTDSTGLVTITNATCIKSLDQEVNKWFPVYTLRETKPKVFLWAKQVLS